MTDPTLDVSDFKPSHRHPRWSVKRLKLHQRQFWFLLTLPPYHNGRGHYVSIGLWLIAIYRGY